MPAAKPRRDKIKYNNQKSVGEVARNRTDQNQNQHQNQHQRGKFTRFHEFARCAAQSHAKLKGLIDKLITTRFNNLSESNPKLSSSLEKFGIGQDVVFSILMYHLYKLELSKEGKLTDDEALKTIINDLSLVMSCLSRSANPRDCLDKIYEQESGSLSIS